MKILGISAFYHDSAAAIIIDSTIIAAAQEERFSRKKHDASFPKEAIRCCLEKASTSLEEIDAVVFYDKPFLKFERLVETYYAYAPKGLRSFVTAMPVWIKEKLFLKRIIRQELRKLGGIDTKKIRLLFSTHHLSHAASAFYPSPFQKAAILTIDAVGEWSTASISIGDERGITQLRELDFPHSVGLLYSAFTFYCGFTVNSGEYKLMGLAPYGNPEDGQTKQFIDTIKQKLINIQPDGSVFLHQQYFTYATGLQMTNDPKWKALFGIERREPDDPLTQAHCNLAFAIQSVTEELVILMAAEAKRLTQCTNLCLAGGVALNCVANGRLQESGMFDELFIQPAAGDAGGALGAALAVNHIYFASPRKFATENKDGMNGSLLGNDFTDTDIREMAGRYDAVYKYYDDEQSLLNDTARWLSQGKVIGWHQGRMEFGPRALGCRSILADARDEGMQQKLNLKIKCRESFRPFAPVMLASEALTFFGLKKPSPYMLLVKKMKPDKRIAMLAGFSALGMKEKLDIKRSELPAITHLDYSARIQTVDPDINPRLFNLLMAFKQLTGYGVLVNTSFNVKDEPIINTPAEAYHCFMHTDMDILVMGNFVFNKGEQGLLQKEMDQ